MAAHSMIEVARPCGTVPSITVGAMPASDTGKLSVVLGRCIDAGTPQGPFEGTALPGYTAASDTGLLHAVEDCPQLRKASVVRRVDFPLNAGTALHELELPLDAAH
ncbi:hypothetical protein [Streptomyces apocyni]|uniref:hypothetical protein n=1 Tax=Streptomyces apocyni TaxID=2654677 RepID=UPI0012EAA991|nr:hypothetical protein [Streptomyces apocyni]